ncbi:hypothetical protein C8T65DRAFT_825889 [Cerioporus squamosus]|nr:hypothetical protein C8T65DRAFT_825887 [Cerioporus squamosus]KAI0721326.1 hypothetical protein C8T65DRAFT_825889 [Cerioporus squamosus]
MTLITPGYRRDHHEPPSRAYSLSPSPPVQAAGTAASALPLLPNGVPTLENTPVRRLTTRRQRSGHRLAQNLKNAGPAPTDSSAPAVNRHAYTRCCTQTIAACCTNPASEPGHTRRSSGHISTTPRPIDVNPSALGCNNTFALAAPVHGALCASLKTALEERATVWPGPTGSTRTATTHPSAHRTGCGHSQHVNTDLEMLFDIHPRRVDAFELRTRVKPEIMAVSRPREVSPPALGAARVARARRDRRPAHGRRLEDDIAPTFQFASPRLKITLPGCGTTPARQETHVWTSESKAEPAALEDAARRLR